MNKILYKILVFLPCLLVLCSSCTDDSDRPWYQDVEALESCYLAAVRDAEEALPQEICRTLPAIVSPDSLDDLRQQWLHHLPTHCLFSATGRRSSWSVR